MLAHACQSWTWWMKRTTISGILYSDMYCISALSFAPIPSANNSCFFIHLLSYSLPLFVFHSQRIKSKIISIESPLSTNSMVQSSLRTTMFLCMLLRMSPCYMRPWNCNLWPSFCLLVSFQLQTVGLVGFTNPRTFFEFNKILVIKQSVPNCWFLTTCLRVNLYLLDIQCVYFE